MDNACRVCMFQESTFTEFFQPISQEIIDMVKYCTGVLIQKQTGLPYHICTKCLTDLHIAHKLKLKCLESEKAFKIMLNLNDPDLIDVPTEGCIKVNVINYNTCKSHSDLTDSGSVGSVSERAESGSEGVVAEPGVQRQQQKRINKEKKPIGKRKSISAPKKRPGVNKFRRLYCEPCQMKFVDRKESAAHRQKMHKEKQQLWICEVCMDFELIFVCGKSYAHRSSQITHMRSHYPERYSCDRCDYSTYNKYDLIKHVKIHTGDKSFKCSHCPAAYRTSSNLRAHVRLKHESHSKFACHVCGQTYCNRAALDCHLDAHYNVKRHACGFCSALFTKRVYMKNHLLKQHGVSMPKVRPGPRKADPLILDKPENQQE